VGGVDLVGKEVSEVPGLLKTGMKWPNQTEEPTSAAHP
jgi:hypothetical protein